MKTSSTYLYFAGQCREAMTFYRHVFGAGGDFTTFGDMPPDLRPQNAPDDWIMHCELHVPGLVLMAGDIAPGAMPGGHAGFAISLSCDSIDEMDRLFAGLSDGGAVTTPVHDAFWGDRIGILTDRFGVSWILSFR